MDVRVGLKKRCEYCQIIRREGVLRRICSRYKNHKGRQPGPKRKRLARVTGRVPILKVIFKKSMKTRDLVTEPLKKV